MLLLLQSSDIDFGWFNTQLFERLFMKLGQIRNNKDCRVITIIGSFYLTDVCG